MYTTTDAKLAIYLKRKGFKMIKGEIGVYQFEDSIALRDAVQLYYGR